MRTLVRGAWVVGYREPTHTLIRNGVVVYEGDTILHVGSSFEGRIDREIDAADGLVIPGFIDTHVHCGHRAPGRLIADTGRPDYFGQPFLEYTVTREGTVMAGDPRYQAPAEGGAAQLGEFTDYTVAELLRNGITTFVEFGARVHVQEALAKGLEKFGIRGYLGAGYSGGRWVGGERGRLRWIADSAAAGRLFREAVEFARRIDGTVDGRARAILVPSGVDTASTEQLRQTAKLACERNWPVATHGAYSLWEFYDVVREQLMTPVEYLESVGLLDLGTKLNIGHANFVAEHPRLAYSGGRDIELIGRHGCSVSHCPVNLARRARYLHYWSRYRSAGVNLTLGSDTYPRDMIMQMRTASYFGKVMSGDLRAASAPEVFEAATLGGARSLGRDDLGRLAPGAKADIVIIDLSGRDTLRYGPVRDPIRSLVECGIGDDVDTVIVGGRICLERRSIPGIDLEALRRSAQAAGEYLWQHWAEWDPQSRDAETVNPWSYPLLPD
jgi:cytosine/adenosine deaminase-related metal-dependent hydrolase